MILKKQRYSFLGPRRPSRRTGQIGVSSNGGGEVANGSILYDIYLNQIRPQLKTSWAYQNLDEIPKIAKVVINKTYPEKSNSKGLKQVAQELSLITGQRPIVTRAKKSIAGFHITQGDSLGLMTSLRGQRMYAFLHRLIHIALPRVRDFRGLDSLSFDGSGNFNLGIREQLMFPELGPESPQSSSGLDISIVTTAQTNQEAYFLLKMLGMPFKKNELWDEFYPTDFKIENPLSS